MFSYGAPVRSGVHLVYILALISSLPIYSNKLNYIAPVIYNLVSLIDRLRGGSVVWSRDLAMLNRVP